MFALTLMQGPAKILIANVRIGLYVNMNSVIYRYFSKTFLNVCPCHLSTEISIFLYLLFPENSQVLFDKNITNTIVAVL